MTPETKRQTIDGLCLFIGLLVILFMTEGVNLIRSNLPPAKSCSVQAYQLPNGEMSVECDDQK